MNQRLVIPKELREKVQRAIDYGHTGRDAVFRETSDKCLQKLIARWWKKQGALSAKKQEKPKTNLEKNQKRQNRMKKFHSTLQDHFKAHKNMKIQRRRKKIEDPTEYISAHGILKRI